tara:strand:- start:359 stop:724 length:366 start_codon:yes stop_codon:yes gene_type:complete
MYSHTRACSIRRKVRDVDASHLDKTYQGEAPSDEMPYGLVQLLRTLAVHDDQLSRVVREHRPNLFANYMLQLSMAYNMFYRDCYVIDHGKVNPFFFAVSERARTALRAGMDALGIVALKSM